MACRSRPPARSSLLLVIGLAVVLVASGCGNDDVATAPGGTDGADTPDPAGTGPATGGSGSPEVQGTWIVVAADGAELVAGSQVVVTFDKEEVGVSPGCNSFGGPFEMDGEVLVVDTDSIMGTLMGCEADLEAQDQWVLALLGSRPTLSVADGELSIAGEDVVLRLAPEREVRPDVTLESVRWHLETIVSGPVASSVPVEVDPPTLVVEGDQAVLFAGCNAGLARVVVDGDAIEFSEVDLTEMACEPAALEVEDDMVATLVSATTFAIEGSTLTITAGDRALVFRAG